MAEFVQLLQTAGPNINEIAKRMKVHKETARYWYREKLVAKGYVVHAVVDYRRLGLKRMLVIGRLSEEYRSKADRLVLGVDGHSYIANYFRAMPEDLIVITASVPEEHASDYAAVMNDLKNRLNLFTEVEVLESDWFYAVPMRAKFYNFENDRWEFEWDAIRKESIDYSFTRRTRAKLDKDDLAIMEKVQTDADVSLAEIAKILGFSYKKVLRHHKHLLDRGVIQGYKVWWTRTQYNEKLGKSAKKTHRYLIVKVVVKDLAPPERDRLVNDLLRFPFLWSISGGPCTSGELMIPLELVNETFSRLREVLSPYGNRAFQFTEDQDQALSFTIASPLFDSRRKQWTFDREEMLGAFEDAMKKSKG